jgi:hypothetical protein
MALPQRLIHEGFFIMTIWLRKQSGIFINKKGKVVARINMSVASPSSNSVCD